MPKIIISIIWLLLLVPQNTAADAPQSAGAVYMTKPAPEETLQDDKIYFFAHSMCSSCKDAFIYLDSHHRGLNIPITDMKFHHNLELYKQCVKKFNIKNAELRLPLLCLGNNYIMGWDNTTSPQAFEEALKNFIAEHAAK